MALNPFRPSQPAARDRLFGQDRLVESMAERLRNGQHCSLEGKRGTGKTSLLDAVAAALADQPVVRVRLGRTDVPEKVLSGLVEGAAGALRVKPPADGDFGKRWAALLDAAYDAGGPPIAPPAGADSAPHDAGRPAGRPIVVLDDTHRAPPETLFTVFSTLNPLADRRQATVLLCGRPAPAEHLRKDVSYLRALVDGFYDPNPLDRDALARLAAPLAPNDAGLDALETCADGNPYRAVWLCAHCFDRGRLDAATLDRANHATLDALLAEHTLDALVPALPAAALLSLEAFLSEAFSRDELRRLVREALGVPLGEIVSDRQPDAEARHDLVSWSDRTGLSGTLARAAVAARPSLKAGVAFGGQWLNGHR